MENQDKTTALWETNHGLPLGREELRKLEQAVTAFHAFTGVPVTYFNGIGEPVFALGAGQRLCSLFDMYLQEESPCRRELASAARISNQLGEPYVFVCKAGLVNIAVAVLLKGKPFGHFIAGPLVMGSLQESLMGNILELAKAQKPDLPKLMVFLRGMSAYSPKEISYLSVLFGGCVMSLLAGDTEYKKLTVRNQEQERIGQHLRMRKQVGAEGELPDGPGRIRQLENRIFGFVQSGEGMRAARAMEELGEELALLEAGDLSGIKVRMLSFCTLLAREADEDSYLIEMDEISEAADLSELSRLASRFVSGLSESFSAVSYAGTSQVIRSALELIHKQYHTRISLTGLAEKLHINPSYLSVLFKQETGMAFTDYLNNYRVVKSRDLLSRTNLPLGEIAGLVGFEDQSYFSKVFRKFTELTPLAYRKSHKAGRAGRDTLRTEADKG